MVSEGLPKPQRKYLYYIVFNGLELCSDRILPFETIQMVCLIRIHSIFLSKSESRIGKKP